MTLVELGVHTVQLQGAPSTRTFESVKLLRLEWQLGHLLS